MPDGTDSPPEPLLSIRELKGRTGAQPLAAIVRAQIDSIQIKCARSGNEFVELRLADSEDGFVLRLWSDGAGFAAARQLPARALIELRGDWTHGAFGLETRNAVVRELTADEAATFLGGSPARREKQAADWAFIAETVEGIADPRLRALSRRFLDAHGERFRRTAAARDYHHARRGGLVEHVAQMMRSALALCSVYPHLNRDLLVAGVLFHDCGKLWENSYPEVGFTMPYSERGELLGHISMGIELVNSLWRGLMESEEAGAWSGLRPSSEEVKWHLLHLIASHHGELQFGSPVFPKTPEAIGLHHIDNIDAKLEMMADGYETSLPLGPNIFERRRPLPASLVRPLPAWSNAEPPPPHDGESEASPQAAGGEPE